MKHYIEIAIDEKNQNFFETLSRLFYLTHLGLVEVAKDKNFDKGNPNKSSIAIAFPDYQFSEKSSAKKEENNKDENIKSPTKKSFKKGFGVIGSRLRLFSINREDLEKFNATKKFSPIQDYIKISEIQEVPISKVTSYAVFTRYQPKTNLAKLTKRYQAREEKLLNIINNSSDQTLINKAKEQLQARQKKRDNLPLKQFIESEKYNKNQLQKVFYPFINVVSNDKNSANKHKNYFKLWVRKFEVSAPVIGEFNTYGFAQNQHGKGSGLILDDIRNLANVPEF